MSLKLFKYPIINVFFKSAFWKTNKILNLLSTPLRTVGRHCYKVYDIYNIITLTTFVTIFNKETECLAIKIKNIYSFENKFVSLS